jgi:hypothetical protein
MAWREKPGKRGRKSVALKSDKNGSNTEGETANVAGMMWRAIVILSALMLLALGGFYTLANWDKGPTWFVSPPEKVLPTDSLEVRGKKLRESIDWAYYEMNKKDAISVDPSLVEAKNNIAPVILRYLPLETNLHDAKEILKSAGFKGWSLSVNHLGENEIYSSIEDYAGVPLSTISVVSVLHVKGSKVTKIEAYFDVKSISEL